MNYQIAFSKTTEKATFKVSENKREENQVEKKLWSWQKLKQKKHQISKSDFEEHVKSQRFSQLIAKARFHIRYFSKDEKICNSKLWNKL